MKKPAVFLDRDGTIIVDEHYVRDPALVKLLPGAVEGIKAITAKGYAVFVVSNQSGVGRGLMTSQEFWDVHRRVCELLQAAGAEIAEFCYCFHTPADDCQCRKPRAGNLPKQFGGVELDWSRSYTCGDSQCDVDLARSIGGTGVLVLTGKGQKTRTPEHLVCADLPALAAMLPDALT